MKTVWIIQATMAIELKNGEIENWDKRPTTFYGFKNYEDAIKEVEKLRQEEVETYQTWLKDSKGCFIHHCYRIDNIMIFDNFNDF